MLVVENTSSIRWGRHTVVYVYLLVNFEIPVLAGTIRYGATSPASAPLG